MRRKDRAMDREFGLRVIDNAAYGILSMIDEQNEPYGIPLSIARDGNTLYFHSAMDGKKVKSLLKNPRVNIAFVGEVKVPENYRHEELQEMAKDPSRAATLISNVFTTEFESVIVMGTVKRVDEESEKIEAMRFICKKYTPTKMAYFDMATESGLSRTNVYSIEIQEITAKRKKYDKSGEEMKWGRME